MHKEGGERRDFLPSFVKRLVSLGIEVVIEQGYGSGMGIEIDAYRSPSGARVAPIEECFAQDVVVVLRYPDDVHVDFMRPGSCLVSMVHLETRPGRVVRLKELGLEAISLEMIVDDTGRRLVENLRSVGWNGMEAAFDLLEADWPDLANPARGALHVLLIGAGAVGAHAMAAAVNYGRRDRRAKLITAGVPGVVVSVVDHDVTGLPGLLEKMLPQSDVVVDATRRPRPDTIVVPNASITLLPEHSVLVDLSVEPYDCSGDPIAVKSIEGMPQGNLDTYMIRRDDPAWDLVPSCVSTKHRRSAVSCYSWPGIHPGECMESYGKQIFPLIRVLEAAGGPGGIRTDGPYFHRAISRAMLSRMQQSA